MNLHSLCLIVSAIFLALCTSLTAQDSGEYQVITHSDFNRLQAEVNERVSKGWQCEGSVCVVFGKGRYNYYQAMTLSRQDFRRQSNYQVLTNQSFQELQKQVNQQVAKGWKCQGGIEVVFGHEDNYHYYQALIR